jgi:hypothetical protein
MHRLNGSNRSASCCKWYCNVFPLETHPSPFYGVPNGAVVYGRIVLTSRGRRTCEIKSRIATIKAAIYKKSLHQQNGLSFKKKLVRRYILSLWGILLYGVETRHFRKVTNTLKVLTRSDG